MWGVHKNGNIFLGLTVWNVHNKRNVCLGPTVWDVFTTGTDWACITVFDHSPIALDLILPSVCDQRAYPRWFLGRVGSVGERSNFKKILRTRKSMVMHSNERGECSLRTLIDQERKR